MITSEQAPVLRGYRYASQGPLPERGVEDIEGRDADCENRESQPILGNGGDRFMYNLSDTAKAKSIWKDTNWRQKSVVIYVSIVNYLNFLCISACSPFLARVVIQKGGTVLLSSVVLQISTVTTAIFCIIFGKYQTKIGSKTLIVSGQMLFALCQIAFGAISYFQNHWIIAAVGMVLRAIQGICQAALNVSCLTIVCHEFPDFISTVFGIFEAAYGVGYLTGPYIGGFLYDWSNGMMVPMAITGLLPLLFSVAGLGILQNPEDRQGPSSESHIRRILSNPKAVFIVGAAGTVTGGFGLCDSTITVYLKTKGFSATKVGQLLFLGGASYCLFAVCIGFVINSRKFIRRFVISLGILGAFAFPLLWLPNQHGPWIYVAAFGFAASAALAFIPAFDELRHIVDKGGAASSDMSLNSALSGIWSASASMYSFAVSLVGSAMELTLPFYISFISSTLVGYLFTILLTLMSVLYKKGSK